jgi:hypothetical protein
MGTVSVADLKAYHPWWLTIGLVMHAVLSGSFGVLLGLLRSRLPALPAALSWGGLLLPLLWTAISFSLMGVVNPLLQHRVDWPWFIVSQFVFGVTAAVVVVRSEKIHIRPAGVGPDQPAHDTTTGESP